MKTRVVEALISERRSLFEGKSKAVHIRGVGRVGGNEALSPVDGRISTTQLLIVSYINSVVNFRTACEVIGPMCSCLADAISVKEPFLS